MTGTTEQAGPPVSPRACSPRRWAAWSAGAGRLPPGPDPPGGALPSEDVPEPASIEGNFSGERASPLPAVAWGTATAEVWSGAWFVGRRWGRWPAHLIGAPLFLVVLLVFFESVSTLLAANF